MISNEIIKFASNTSNVGLTNKYTFKSTKKNSMCGDLIKIELILKNSKRIRISADFGKYNINNFDTIFSKNVLITYLDNKIKANYLDFSLEKNFMIISGKVIYNSLENILEADVVEINIKTKDTKIFMYENKKKVNIRSIN